MQLSSKHLSVNFFKFSKSCKSLVTTLLTIVHKFLLKTFSYLPIAQYPFLCTFAK